MSAAKHTPGPWHVSDVAQGLVVYDDQGWAVADAKVFHARHTLEEAQANARLIAATPNLLEMLSICVEILEKVDPSGYPDTDDILRDAIDTSKRVIDLAKVAGGAA